MAVRKFLFFNTSEGFPEEQASADELSLAKLTVTGSSGIGLDMSSQRIANLLDPETAQEAATKAYVDTIVAGMGGNNSVNTGNVIVDFGGPLEDFNATVTVTGQSWVTSTSKILAIPSGVTSDHDSIEDAIIEGLVCSVGNIVEGVGFDIVVGAPCGTWGQYNITWQGA